MCWRRLAKPASTAAPRSLHDVVDRPVSAEGASSDDGPDRRVWSCTASHLGQGVSNREGPEHGQSGVLAHHLARAFAHDGQLLLRVGDLVRQCLGAILDPANHARHPIADLVFEAVEVTEFVAASDRDDPDILAMMVTALGGEGYRIATAEDGAEALDFIYGMGKYSSRNTNNIPKVILLDLKLPKIGGIEVLQKVKADARTKSIPVVVLTSSAEDPDIKKCYELGANSYIVKPVQFDNFAKTIANIGLYWVVVNKI